MSTLRTRSVRASASEYCRMVSPFSNLRDSISFEQSFWNSEVGTLTMIRVIKSKSKFCYDLRSVSQSVSVSSPIWGPRPHFSYCQTVAGLLIWGALSDERTGLSYNCCWSSPAQSFSGLSSAGLMTIFYCLRLWYELQFASPRHTRTALRRTAKKPPHSPCLPAVA
jgi:hypothetical protein